MDIESLKEELAKTVHFLHEQGWAPANSSNYSFRIPGKEEIYISETGVDKLFFSADNLMKVSPSAGPADKNKKPSSDLLLHLEIYENASANSVLHIHSVSNTVISHLFKEAGKIEFSGFEILKAFGSNYDLLKGVIIPVFPSYADRGKIAEEVRAYRKNNPPFPAYLLASHGLYCWGNTISEARRHLEVLEFLFECRIQLMMCKNG